MYGLPSEFDGQFFIGRELEQICFNANQISLHFDGQVAITIEGGYSCGIATTPIGTPTHAPTLHPNIRNLVGHVVARVESAHDGTLSLLFDNGGRVTCFDDPQYESYRIRNRDKVIIV